MYFLHSIISAFSYTDLTYVAFLLTKIRKNKMTIIYFIVFFYRKPNYQQKIPNNTNFRIYVSEFLRVLNFNTFFSKRHQTG